VPARELFELRYGRALVAGDRQPGNVPVYGSNGKTGRHDAALFDGPGVILGRKGQGPLGVEWSDGDYWVIDTAYSLKVIRHDIDLKFAYYLIKLVGLNHLKDGTSNPTLSRDAFGAQAFPVPPSVVQRTIANIVGNLDAKIELNRRTDETLEAIAQALFKSWFVDFDPVRAKSEGRDPGLPPHLADLFPDSFEDSELGEIPTGWRVSGLDEIATYLNGLALQKYPPDDERSLPVVKIAQLRAGHTEGADRASAGIPGTYVVEDGDILFSWSGSLEVEVWCGGRGALNQHLFKVTSNRFPKWFYFLWTRHHLADFRGIAAGKATTMGHIQLGHLTGAKAVVPPAPLLDAMTGRFQPLLEDLVAVRLQSRTLGMLRQTLLPKLMSGEIDCSVQGG